MCSTARSWDGARVELSASASRADPDLAEAGSPEGLTSIVDDTEAVAQLVVPFVRTRSQNLYGRIGLTFSNSVTETEFAGTVVEETDRLAVLEGRLTWDFADRRSGVNLIDAAVRQGLDVGSVTLSSDGPAAGQPDFTAASTTLSRLQSLGESSWALYGEVIGQYAFDVLPSSERFFPGESTIGRGFAPGNTSGDSGYGARLELRRYLGGAELAPVAEAAEPYAFADYGRAYDRSIAATATGGRAWGRSASVRGSICGRG